MGEGRSRNYLFLMGCFLFLALVLGTASCGGQGTDSALAPPRENVTITGIISSSQEGPGTKAQTESQPNEDEETPLLCSVENFVCTITFSGFEGDLIHSAQVIITLPTCNELPVNGETVSLGNYSVDPSTVADGFSLSVSCMAASGSILEEFFGTFDCDLSIVLGPDGTANVVCTLGNLFDGLTSDQAIVLAIQFGCPTLLLVTGLTDDCEEDDEGFLCGFIKDIIDQALAALECEEEGGGGGGECGDGTADEGEVCGEPNSPACPPAHRCVDCICITNCGNRQLDFGEVCDQSAIPNGCEAGQLCSRFCDSCVTQAVCGDDICQPNENFETCPEDCEAGQDFCIDCPTTSLCNPVGGGTSLCFDSTLCPTPETIGVWCGPMGNAVCEAAESKGAPPSTCDGTCCSTGTSDSCGDLVFDSEAEDCDYVTGGKGGTMPEGCDFLTEACDSDICRCVALGCDFDFNCEFNESGVLCTHDCFLSCNDGVCGDPGEIINCSSFGDCANCNGDHVCDPATGENNNNCFDCPAPRCGNGAIEGKEVCEGADLNGCSDPPVGAVCSEDCLRCELAAPPPR